MKKFVFAAIAAMVMVSVSNVFASSKMMIDNSEVVPVDTVAPETPKDSADIQNPHHLKDRQPLFRNSQAYYSVQYICKSFL